MDLVEDLVIQGIASRLDDALCSQLQALLSRQFPWAGTHLAWDQIPGSVSLTVSSFSSAGVAGFMSRLAATQNRTVCALFSRHLCLRFPSEWLLRNLDVAACNAEQFFAFASERESEAAHSVAEFELGCTIWGMLPNNALQATRETLAPERKR